MVRLLVTPPPTRMSPWSLRYTMPHPCRGTRSCGAVHTWFRFVSQIWIRFDSWSPLHAPPAMTKQHPTRTTVALHRFAILVWRTRSVCLLCWIHEEELEKVGIMDGVLRNRILVFVAFVLLASRFVRFLFLLDKCRGCVKEEGGVTTRGSVSCSDYMKFSPTT